jgi:FSR family fosmidomycin resistance protein-like MFS transporter
MQSESPQDRSERPVRGRLYGGLVASAHLANDAVTSMLPVLLPGFAGRFQLTPSELAALAGGFAVSTSLPQPFFGSLADRFGGHRIGALGLAVSGLLIASLGFVSSLPWLCVLLLLGGLGSSALHPAGLGLARAASDRNPGLGVALFNAAGMAGGAAGPLLVGLLTAALGSNGGAWAAVPVLAIAMLLFLFAPRAPVVARADGVSPRTTLQALRGPLGPLALIAVCANVVTLTFASAAPVWLVVERGIEADSPIIGWTLATFWGGAAAGGISGASLGRWLTPKSVVAGSLALSLLPLQGVLVSRPGSVPYLIAVVAAGALLFAHTPLVMTRAQESAPGSNSAVAGILLGGTTAVAAVIYAGLGVAQAAFGLGGTIAATFFVVLPAAGIAAWALAPAPRAPLRTFDTRPAALTVRPRVLLGSSCAC